MFSCGVGLKFTFLTPLWSRLFYYLSRDDPEVEFLIPRWDDTNEEIILCDISQIGLDIPGLNRPDSPIRQDSLLWRAR